MAPDPESTETTPVPPEESAETSDSVGTAVADPPTDESVPEDAQVDSTDEPTDEEEQWRQEQKLQAEAQGLTSENAVPEQRPIASQRVDAPDNPLTQKLREAGELNDEPMNKEAYDRADSDDQREAAAEVSRKPAVHVGSVVRITGPEDSPHIGRQGAVVRVISWASAEDALVKQLGTPESAYAQADQIEVRTRGAYRDGELLIVSAADVEAIDFIEYGKPSV